MPKLRLLLCCLFLYVTMLSQAQWNRASVVSYIAEIPVIVESQVFIDSLVKNQSLQLISSHIRISLAPRNIKIANDLYYPVGKPIDPRSYPGIEYRCYIADSLTAPWKNLPIISQALDRFPFAGMIADTNLNPGKRLVLQFRYKGSKTIFRQFDFYRAPILPDIVGFHQTDQKDTVVNKLASGSRRIHRVSFLDFIHLKGNTIEVSPGKQLELMFKKQEENLDSCILYRLVEKDSVWKTTGHLLNLNELSSNKTYTLEVKYAGINMVKRYQVTILAFWHQTVAARILFILLSAAICFTTWIAITRFQSNRNHKIRLHAHEQVKKAQSNVKPHFIFNALSSIDNLIITGENKTASQYLYSFSDLMRKVIPNSELITVSLAEDIDTLDNYLRIEQLRFGFTYTIYVDPSLDLDIIDMPPMLLQPTVENAVLHGVSSLREKGQIKLMYLRNEDTFLIKVMDNGTYQEPMPRAGHGNGILFTKEIIAHLRKIYPDQQIGYELVHTGYGTTATFYFESWLA